VKTRKSFFFLIALAIIYSFIFFSIGYSEERGKESDEWEKLRSTSKEIWRINVQRY